MDVTQNESRRRFLKQLATGATVVALGGLLYEIADDNLEREARAQKRADGRVRLPPGQRLIRGLRPMGGIPYEGTNADWRLRIHGEVDREITLDFQQLLKLPQTEQLCDVHCVTAWTVLDAKWLGVRVAELAKMVGMRRSARHVIFEVYAVSGLAVNHVADWDPNFKHTQKVVELGGPVDETRVLAALAIHETPREIYRAGPEQLEIAFDKRSLHVNTRTGRVVDEGDSP